MRLSIRKITKAQRRKIKTKVNTLVTQHLGKDKKK